MIGIIAWKVYALYNVKQKWQHIKILNVLLLLLLSRFSRVWLCHPIDGSPPGFPVPGILQARTLEWVAISFSNAWKWKVKGKSTLHDPMDRSLPDSSVHGIFQAKILEWGAIECCVNKRQRLLSLPMGFQNFRNTYIIYTMLSHNLKNSFQYMNVDTSFFFSLIPSQKVLGLP